jgi:hypothetical protein
MPLVLPKPLEGGYQLMMVQRSPASPSHLKNLISSQYGSVKAKTLIFFNVDAERLPAGYRQERQGRKEKKEMLN